MACLPYIVSIHACTQVILSGHSGLIHEKLIQFGNIYTNSYHVF